MKAVSLYQPYASLMAVGEKQYETRSWPTKHRGPIAIHATIGFPRWCRENCERFPFDRALAEHDLDLADLVGLCSHIVAVVNVVDCVETHGRAPTTEVGCGAYEFYFGDYSKGRWAWITSSVTRLERPVRVARGWQGIWNVQPDNVAEIEDQLR